jgi:isochorismate pyruvate lyase
MSKLPEDCQNLTDIRSEIDRLDREIIAKLSQRYNYVKAASKFKTSETSVKVSNTYELKL